jgi:transcriptional regulator with GAF, ATPase, and Fis domain
MPSAAQVTEEPAAADEPAAANEPAGAEGIRAALEAHGSVQAAARALGVAESTLRTRAKRYGISTGRGKGGKRGPSREEAA